MVGVPNGFPVVVVGAGQAGLAVSYELTARGVEHVVLERARVGQSWLGLWDSFCLVTPNWTMSLPGAAYTGDDPEGFVPRDEIVRYLQRYASSFGAPVREGVGVDSLEPGPNGGFLLRTSAGELRAASVVVCTGAYQRPHRPEVAAGFPRDVLVIDAQDYRNPAALPPGKVLVVGSGQTGCQLSEELHEVGPRGVPGLRTGAVAAAAARRPRHRHLAQGDHLLRHPAQRPALTRSSAGRQPARDRPPRRP